jgi:hypothetical protein
VVTTSLNHTVQNKKGETPGLASRLVPNILQLVRAYVGAPCFGGGKKRNNPVTEYVVPVASDWNVSRCRIIELTSNLMIRELGGLFLEVLETSHNNQIQISC